VCSKKIQDEINKLDGVKRAEFNFATKEMHVEFDGMQSEVGFFSKLEQIVHSFEPDVEVIAPMQLVSQKENKDSALRQIVRSNRAELIGVAVFAAALFAERYLTQMPIVAVGLFLAAYLLIGGDILRFSARNISRGRIFDENFLMSVATIGAMALGDFTEGVAVMLFYKIGESLSDFAQERSIRSVNDLLKLKIPMANLMRDGNVETVASESVEIGDTLLVKVGEQVPVDSVIVSGSAYADTKSVTGESASRFCKKGDAVYSGYIITDSPITVKALKKYEDSIIAKIIHMTREASQNKAKTEKYITKFAMYYTPIVVFAAVAVAVLPPLFGAGTFADWIKRGLIFLVISCPCALVLSIPLSYFAGIGAASRNGILIKGANHLETLAKVKTAVFDKTGTLTKGAFRVQKIVPSGISAQEATEYLAAAESLSNHPLAKAITNFYGKPIDQIKISDFREFAGKGVSLIYQGKHLKAGTAEFTDSAQTDGILGATAVYLTINGKDAGYVLLADEAKTDSAQAIREIKQLGVEKTVMLTGDNRSTAEAIGNTLGIDEVKAELLPDEKVAAYRSINGEKNIMFVGDGINDAPVIALSDVGVSMGALGSDAAIEASDVVIMTDRLGELPKALRIARFTKRIIIQNIAFVLFVKLFVMTLGAIGIATMGEAVFADVGTALIATLNSMRILKQN
jgi:Cd2+/Zn2+-exporting ATPase